MGVLVSGGLVSGLLRAQNGAGAEAGKLLEQLKSLEETVTKARTGNNLAAVDEIREAAGAEAKAVALWIESVRETEFRDKDKKESDFRAWREGAGRRLSDPGAPRALCLHLQYLLLSIRATTATTDEARAELFSSLLSYLDDLSRADKDVLKNRQALDTSVLATPIARRFKLDITVRPPEGWSLNPGNLETIYEATILPYLREKKDAARLQLAWTRRLQQEAAMIQTQDSEFLTKNYQDIVLPTLEWAQARDLHLAGASGSSAKMLQIIQENQGHKNAPQWISELRALLTGVAIGNGAPAAGAAGGDGGTTPPEAPEAPEAGDSTKPAAVPAPGLKPAPKPGVAPGLKPVPGPAPVAKPTQGGRPIVPANPLVKKPAGSNNPTTNQSR